MSPRTGRPTDDPKDRGYRLRVSDADLQMLDYCVEVLGLSKAEIIREGIKRMYDQAQKKRGEIMLNAVSYGYVIKRMELLDGTVYTDVSTSKEQMEGFIGINFEGDKPLYVSKSAIKTIEFTGERW